jgi:flagellar motor switch protein FliN/FliY
LTSDLSNIIKEDISSTLGSLLSVSTLVKQTTQASLDDFKDQQYVCVDANFEFSNTETFSWKFYVPSLTATKFEFLMLGGIENLKDAIDDEIADAINEIVSNICGSISTNINAQNFSDLGSVKSTVNSSTIVQSDTIESLENIFKFDMNLGDEELILFIEFPPLFLQYISFIVTGKEAPISNQKKLSTSSGSNIDILSLLDEDSIDNLKLLFDIKFKLSVRLGTKVLLLKDITTWDTGTIIELEQMVNEPLDILANGTKIGEGEAVIVDGKFGIKIKYIGNRKKH